MIAHISFSGTTKLYSLALALRAVSPPLVLTISAWVGKAR